MRPTKLKEVGRAELTSDVNEGHVCEIVWVQRRYREAKAHHKPFNNPFNR